MLATLLVAPREAAAPPRDDAAVLATGAESPASPVHTPSRRRRAYVSVNRKTMSSPSIRPALWSRRYPNVVMSLR